VPTAVSSEELSAGEIRALQPDRFGERGFRIPLAIGIGIDAAEYAKIIQNQGS
jgi:hypothetical protein